MTALTWDGTGERLYETGVDHGVLYTRDGSGDYTNGYAWNGLTNVSEAPSGAEATKLYADNIPYLNLISQELFGATVEAYTYPDEFAVLDGSLVPTPGLSIGQQARGTFGLSYRTRVGDDLVGDALGYKIHLIYGATAAPSEKAYATVNDTPEAITFSWELSTIPIAVTATPNARPTASIVIDSTKVDETKLADLLVILYGDGDTDPRLPLPDEVIGLIEDAAAVAATPTAPTYNSGTHVVTIPTTTGITYREDSVTGDPLTAGAQPALGVGETLKVVATWNAGYKRPTTPYDDDWLFSY